MKFFKSVLILNRIASLERKQARPLREITNATLAGKDIPDQAKRRLFELENQIKYLRNLLS